jgi:serine protease Do
MRAGKHMNVQVEAIAPPDDPPREDRVLEGRHPLNGVKIANLNPAVEVELGLSLDAEGVVVLSAPASGRMIRFLSPGDLLLEINGRKIKRPGDVEAALKAGDSGQGWMFLINSRGRIQRIVIR